MPTIIKKGGGRADYDRDKLRASMLLSMRKRPVPREAVDEAIARIEDKLLSSAQRELKSEKIGELVMRELKRLDKVAYIRFASVYRSFEDVDEFAEVVREVRPERRQNGRSDVKEVLKPGCPVPRLSPSGANAPPNTIREDTMYQLSPRRGDSFNSLVDELFADFFNVPTYLRHVIRTRRLFRAHAWTCSIRAATTKSKSTCLAFARTTFR